MASGTTYPLAGVYKMPGAVIVAGTFQINGTSAPDVLIGNGWTVARSDVGKFTVTFTETFPRCVAVVATMGETGDDGDHQCHVDEIDRTAVCSSVVVYTRVGGTDTDTDDSQVNFIAIMANSTLVQSRSS